MTTRDPTVMPHQVSTVRVGNGWAGRYTLPGRTCHVRGDDGLVRVFDDREAAERAAYRAMIAELNGPAGVVEGKARSITRNSRWARANAAFEGTRG